MPVLQRQKWCFLTRKTAFYGLSTEQQGNPVKIVQEQLQEIYTLTKDRIRIRKAVTTGYGEALIKNAFNLDMGEVETIAHYSCEIF